MPDFSNFACDKCGACCRALIVEASFVDAEREPRLYEIASPGLDREKFRRHEQCIMLWSTETHACPFLGDDNQCRIYQTRPQCCVGVEAGDAKCQQAREVRELPILCDRAGSPPSRELMQESADEYELDWVPYFDGAMKGGE